MEYSKLTKQFTGFLASAVLCLPLLFISACGNGIPEQRPPLVERTPLDAAIIADTVIYDVIVKNPDAADLWAEQSLRNLNRSGLVDIIFNAIYHEELIPYDYFTMDVMSVRDVAKLENDPEFSRDNIGMLQFSEEWYFDEDNLRMEKRVNSISLGYEVYDTDGNIRGYKPAFLINLN